MRTISCRVKFSCGHTGFVEISGNREDKDNKIRWYENYGLCRECYAIEEDKKRAEGCTEVLMRYAEYKQKWGWLPKKYKSYNRNDKTVIVYFPKEYEGIEKIISEFMSIEDKHRDVFFTECAEILTKLAESKSITPEQHKVLIRAACDIYNYSRRPK